MKKSPGIRTLRLVRVAQYLRNELMSLPYGGKMPSVRAIMKKTGTGRLTVAHALNQLQNEGVIRIDPCSGIYRIKGANPEGEIRLIHFQQNDLRMGSFVSVLFQSLVGLAESDGRCLVVENAGQRTPEKIAQKLAEDNISSCILYGAPQPDFMRHLKRRIAHCMELLPRHNDLETVAMRDSPDMTIVQMNYLLKLGYRRIGCLHYGGKDAYLYPIQMLRLLDYYRIMAENGLKVDPDWVLLCSDLYDNLDAGMKKMMSTHPKPEALIASGGAMPFLYEWCRKNHIRVGTDLAVFSADDVNADLKPEATTVTNNPKEIADSFWEMFKKAERGEPVESRYTQLSIRTGRTVPGKTRPV